MNRLAKRVYLIDDYPGMLTGLADFLAGYREFCVCGMARTAEQARREIAQLQPDLALVDIDLHTDCGLELIGQLRQRHPSLPLVAYSGYLDPRLEGKALGAGATCYLEKTAIGDLVPTLRAALGDGSGQASSRCCAR